MMKITNQKRLDLRKKSLKLPNNQLAAQKLKKWALVKKLRKEKENPLKSQRKTLKIYLETSEMLKISSLRNTSTLLL
jgi:hypothetical protein